MSKLNKPCKIMPCYHCPFLSVKLNKKLEQALFNKIIYIYTYIYLGFIVIIIFCNSGILDSTLKLSYLPTTTKAMKIIKNDF